MIPLQLPTPHSTTITSGCGGWACDSLSAAHTTLYYNHFWWWVSGSRFPFSYPHNILLQSILVVGVRLVIPLQLPTPHSTTIDSGCGNGACDSPSVTHTTFYYNQFWLWKWCLSFPFNYPHHNLLQSILVVGVCACDSPSITHTTFYYNQFWWWGLGL